STFNFLKTPQEILKKYWGFDVFRPLQEEIIHRVLEKKDALALLPTGGGKSLCYQIPALMQEGLCVVISPLIALMKDQVAHLTEKNISAKAIYGSMSKTEMRDVFEKCYNGEIKFLFISPERLQSEIFLEELDDWNICLFAIDEAHCVSQWGFDFRPSYLQLSVLRKIKPNVPILALTATATKNVQKDIEEKLLLQSLQKFIASFSRPNLSFSVFEVENKLIKVLDIVKKVAGTKLIYCRSRKACVEISQWLKQHQVNADFYHAGIEAELRNDVQEKWIAHKIDILVCTNAFGMGIDKADVRLVIHYDLPSSLEAYYQEAGRAGRDGKKSYATVLFQKTELENLQSLIDSKFPPIETIKKIYGLLGLYLEIPFGEGEGCFFDIDLTAFSAHFNLNFNEVKNCLHLLKQQQLISYNDAFLQDSKIELLANEEQLLFVENNFIEASIVLKSLLRLYSGLWNFAQPIQEQKIAQICQFDIKTVKKELQHLHEMNFLVYQAQKENEQLFFIQDRKRNNELMLDENFILWLKTRAVEQQQSVLDYVFDNSKCRMEKICHYFEEEKTSPCGICDICLQNKKKNISTSEIENNIELQLKNKNSTIEELISSLNSSNKELYLKIIRGMIDQNKIKINSFGELEWRRK
ncbi:MAG: RecQ family ATP-dependent DNA helicase, partial [Chitinophagaceae bacterium]|nr:RecQ family ATP-dependent DNA helicase [Chitinophagaceae bacterium]